MAIKKKVGLRDVIFRIFVGGQFLTSLQENSTTKTLSKLFRNPTVFAKPRLVIPSQVAPVFPSWIQLLSSAEMLDMSDEYKKHELYVYIFYK